MNTFPDFMREWEESQRKTASHKADEYANERSRLGNFYTADELYKMVKTNGIPQSIYKTMVKHMAWLIDVLNGEISWSEALLREHLGDIHIYFYLMEYAMLSVCYSLDEEEEDDG